MCVSCGASLSRASFLVFGGLSHVVSCPFSLSCVSLVALVGLVRLGALLVALVACLLRCAVAGVCPVSRPACGCLSPVSSSGCFFSSRGCSLVCFLAVVVSFGRFLGVCSCFPGVLGSCGFPLSGCGRPSFWSCSVLVGLGFPGLVVLLVSFRSALCLASGFRRFRRLTPPVVRGCPPLPFDLLEKFKKICKIIRKGEKNHVKINKRKQSVLQVKRRDIV